MGSKILITGAAGYLGRVLRDRLPGHELRLTDVEALMPDRPLGRRA